MGLFKKGKSAPEEKQQTIADIADGEYPDAPLDISDLDIDTVIKRFQLVVVDCWAPWCGPCNMIHPIINDLAVKHKGKIVFGKLNTDSSQATAIKYGIMSIPTLMVFKNGELADRIVGAMPKPMLEQKITRHL
ncbi:MAG: thioredoxin [Thermoplasmata archaeon]|nr:thioredoxin [Thermoplasmata archaeon]